MNRSLEDHGLVDSHAAQGVPTSAILLETTLKQTTEGSALNLPTVEAMTSDAPIGLATIRSETTDLVKMIVDSKEKVSRVALFKPDRLNSLLMV